MPYLNPVRNILIFAGLVVMLGYNNCGKVHFAMDIESLKGKLNADGGILINGGAPYTNSTNVSLSLIHGSADEMYITDVSDCGAGGAWEPYSPTKPWVLKASNAAGKVFVKYREKAVVAAESECFSAGIVHDNIAPTLRITRDVAPYINTASARVEFVAEDGGSGIDKTECSSNIDSTAQACAGAFVQASLGEGANSIRIAATDRAGNVAVPVFSHFIVDRTAPVVTLNQTPPSVTGSVSADFRFSAVDTLSGVERFECQLDSQAGYSPCANPLSQTVAEGARRIQVRAIDRAGNTGEPASYSWMVDLTAPAVRIVKSPASLTNATTASFEFDGMDDGQPITRFECSLNGGAYGACSSPHTYSGLVGGTRSFAVRGIDDVGNRSAPATYSWVIDLVAPTITISSRPAPVTNATNATIAFLAQDNSGSIERTECRIDGGAFAPCSSPKDHTNLNEGNHQVDVRAVDGAGNISAPVAVSWIIDRTKPLVEITSGPLAQTNVKNATLAFRASDPGTTDPARIARLECQIDSGSWQTCSSPSQYPGLDDGNHAFQVRAIDAAGNVSDPAMRAWFLDATPPAINFGKQPLSTIPNIESATIQYTVTDAGVGMDTVSCGLNGLLTACEETKELNLGRLAPGDYVFAVEARDKLGNTSRVEAKWRVELATMEKSQAINVNSNNKVDVLVIIDNSGSMDSEQQNMASRFGTFLDQLKTLDWQVAIITTDVSANAEKKDGRFLPFSSMSNAYILDSSMDLAAAKAAFATTIQRPSSEGSGAEQGIRATYRAIERALDPNLLAVNAPNRAFFRPGAAFAALVVTDADETASGGTKDSNRPEFLVKLVADSWMNQKTFSFHSIVVKSGDAACLKQSANEGYGYAYESLSRLTGGIIGTVCATDYGSQLADMGQGVAELVRSATLACQPLDMTGDGVPDIKVVTADMSPAPSHVIEGNKIVFSAPLPLGNNSLSYTCLKQ